MGFQKMFNGGLKERGHIGFSRKRSEGDLVALRLNFDLFTQAADLIFICGFEPAIVSTMAFRVAASTQTDSSSSQAAHVTARAAVSPLKQEKFRCPFIWPSSLTREKAAIRELLRLARVTAHNAAFKSSC
jgi:hypothetical protein